jgi:hypothetical protein
MVGGRAPGPWFSVSLRMRGVVPECSAFEGNRRQHGGRKGARALVQRVTAHAQSGTECAIEGDRRQYGSRTGAGALGTRVTAHVQSCTLV